MTLWQQSIQAEYNDLFRAVKQQAGKDEEYAHYTPPDVKEELADLKNQLDCNQRRIDTVIKIKNNEPITLSEKKFLLMMPIFNNTVVSRYSNVAEQENTVKNSF